MPATRMGAGIVVSASRREEPLLERAQRGLLGRLGVIPAADVERAVGHEQAQLSRRGPVDIAGLAAVAARRLVDRPLDRDDDVAEMRPAPGRTGEERRIGRTGARGAL